MITTKQRAYLRGLANRENAILQIGKDGVTGAVIENIAVALEARELVKVSLLETCAEAPRDAMAGILDGIAGAEPVQVIGRKLVIYKRNLKEPKIVLP